MWLLRGVVAALAALGLAIALWPEPSANVTASPPVRVLVGHPGEVAVAQVLDRDQTAPASVRQTDLRILRSWTLEGGVRPMVVEFGPIRRTPYLGVLYQGFIFEADGENALFLRCSNEPRIKEVSVGGVNTTLTETIVKLDRDWCRTGEIYLKVVGGPTRNIGAAPPYARSAIAYLKASYLGYVGFFLAAFGVLFAAFFAGGLAARRFGRGLDPVLGGLLAVGGASLLAFYIYAWTPVPAPAGLAAPLFFGAVCLWARRAAPDLARSVWRAQRGPVQAWFLVGIVAVTVLHLASMGVGAWEPAFRFAPAVWSSDHTLAGVFAEVARIGALPQEGNVGGWSLSDRPPLLAGAYLLVADLIALMQVNNDGAHLQPVALGVAGVAACSMWAVPFYWAVRRAAGLGAGVAAVAVALVAATPFGLFNTVYTWPKLFGAAFSLAAAAYVFRRRARTSVGEATGFGALAALSLLSHAASAFFLAPVSLIYLLVRLWRAPKALLIGAATGLVLLGSWSAFKLTVLPSHDPLLGFALTGELTFEPSPLAPRLIDRYRHMRLDEWVKTKVETGAYLFTPRPAPGPTALTRPPVLHQTDLASRLRFWDFYSLSAGNLSLLLLGGCALAGAIASRRSPTAGVARSLTAASLGCYALFVVATFLPLFVHQFSYDAILAVALAGVITLGTVGWGRWSLLAMAGANLIYTLLVWVAFPLGEARQINLAALGVLLLLAIAFGLGGGRRAPPRSWALWAGLGLAVATAVALIWRPGALILERAPHAVASSAGAVAAGSCIGNFDGLVRQKDGRWRAYGWAWDSEAGARAKAVLIKDAEGKRLGVAASGRARLDVPRAVPAVTDDQTGWSITLPTRPAAPQAFALLASGAECHLGTPAP